MHFVLQIPSLQRLAGVKIVAHLWTQPGIIIPMASQAINCLTGFSRNENSAEWLAIEKKVESKVWALPLPQLCKKQLLSFVNPLGIELMAWCQYHNEECNVYQFPDILLPHQLCWTMHGTIDYAKTAELMVKDERLDVVRRYEIACVNCLEDEARELFESMEEERRQEYVNEVYINMSKPHHQHLLIFFTCSLTGEVNRLNIFFQCMFSRGSSVIRVLFDGALLHGDGRMCQHWFEKLSQGEKEQVLGDFQMQVVACLLSRSSSALYYFSRMNEKQQERMFRKSTGVLLKCLLGWPKQSLFFEAVQCGWKFVNKEIYSDVLSEITQLITQGYKDWDYSQLFWECWRLSPAENKHHFLNDIDRLQWLCETKEEEIVKLVFTEVSSHHLKKLVENR